MNSKAKKKHENDDLKRKNSKWNLKKRKNQHKENKNK